MNKPYATLCATEMFNIYKIWGWYYKIFDHKNNFFKVFQQTVKSQYNNILAAGQVVGSILITSVKSNDKNILFIEGLKSISSGLANLIQILSNCQYWNLSWSRREVQTKPLFCNIYRNSMISSWLEGSWWWRKWICWSPSCLSRSQHSTG